MGRLPALVPGDGALAPRLLLLFPGWLILAVGLLTPVAALAPDQGDVGLYFNAAHRVVLGEVPYRDFAFHYPPGGLITMLVPMLGGIVGPVDLAAYKTLLAGWQAVLALVLALLLARIAERITLEQAGDSAESDAGVSRAVTDVAGRLALLAVGAVLVLTWRYDLFPAVLVMVAVWAAIERRPMLAGIALGIGVLAKLYPIAVLPAIAIPWLVPLDFRGLLRLGGGLAVTIVAGLVPFIILAGRHALGFFEYQVGHGIQIESVGGGLTVLAGLLTGTPQPLSFQNARVQVEGPFADAILGIVPFATIVVFGLLAWVGWRRVRRETPGGTGRVSATAIVTLAGASVMVLLVTSKVYSIQYVVWLLPFMALQRGPGFLLALGIAALTMPIHPLLYGKLVHEEALPIVLLNLRNGLLVVLTGWTLFHLVRQSPVGRAEAPVGVQQARLETER